MKTKNILFPKIIVFIIFLGALSCKEDVAIQNAQHYDLSNANVLTFKNESEVFAYLNTAKDKISNFMSIDDLYKKVLTQLADSTNVEHSRLLEEYRDVITVADSTYTPVMENSTYRVICNRDRLYVIGNLVHKVLDNQYIIFTEKQNVDALIKIKSVIGIDASIFKVAQYQEFNKREINGRTKANCGSYFKVDYFDNHSGCKNDRRAWVETQAYFFLNGITYTPMVLAKCWGEIRRGNCNWYVYDTPLTSINSSFTVGVTYNGGTNLYSKGSSDVSEATESVPGYPGYWVIYGAYLNGNPIGSPVGPSFSPNGTPSIQFTAIHFETSTQGVGANDPSHYAVIDCR